MTFTQKAGAAVVIFGGLFSFTLFKFDFSFGDIYFSIFGSPDFENRHCRDVLVRVPWDPQKGDGDATIMASVESKKAIQIANCKQPAGSFVTMEMGSFAHFFAHVRRGTAAIRVPVKADAEYWLGSFNPIETDELWEFKGKLEHFREVLLSPEGPMATMRRRDATYWRDQGQPGVPSKQQWKVCSDMKVYRAEKPCPR
jgi:hypothetical protein